jgi:hypothetical protein
MQFGERRESANITNLRLKFHIILFSFFKRGAGSDSCHRHVRIEKGINGVSVRNEEQLFL